MKFTGNSNFDELCSNAHFESLFTLLLLYQDPDGSYNKSQDSNVACPQIYYTSPVGQEDCLFLNVYVPEKVFTEGISEYLPVMVWIHGGALEVGWNSFSSSG